jgi:hypothetical protein
MRNGFEALGGVPHLVPELVGGEPASGHHGALARPGIERGR